MELIAISDPGFIRNELFLLNQLFEAGLPLLHLRKEGLDRAGYRQTIRGIARRYHPRIVLHQFHELIAEFDIQRLHYPEKMRLQMNNFSSKHINSTSVHLPEDLQTLNGFSYAFLSPVFDSISKTGYKGISATLPAQFHKPNHLKVIALGGICADNISQIKAMHFDGAAVMGALWRKPEKSLHTFHQIRALC